jgi:hypothetical protein
MKAVREKFLAFFDPNRSILFFVVGTAALTIAIEVIYDTVKERQGLVGTWALALLLVIAAVLAIIYQMVRRRPVGHVEISEEQKPPPCSGLILLISPHRGTSTHAIEYHLQEGALKHCWLIASGASLPIAEKLWDQYQDRVVDVHWGEHYMVDADEMQDTYDMVTRILEEEVPAVGLNRADVIADITGGQKPMTAGMALACLAKRQQMQYMKARRGLNGEPDPNVAPGPVRIDITFIAGGPIA